MNRENWKNGLAIEWFLAGLILLSLVHTIWYLFTYHYLPPPYFYQPLDIHGDWFNTSFWAHNPVGAFETWTTLYPPLSFVLLRIFSVSKCYPHMSGLDGSPGYAARGCDWIGHLSIFGFWLLSIVLIFIALRKFDKSKAIPRTICIGLGWPILNGIERGNLALMAFPFFLLAVMPILKSARARWVFAAMAINLKIYLITPFIAQLIMRRWRWVEGVLLATVLTYCLSYMILGAGTLSEILRNITAWGSMQLTNPLDFWPATTYQGLGSLLQDKNQVFPSMMLFGERTVENLSLAITIVLRVTQASLLAAITVSWLRPEAITRYRMYALATLFALISAEGGGYTPIFWTVLVMVEKWQGWGPRIAISLCYLMGISYDINIIKIDTVTFESYIFGTQVTGEMNVTLWPLIRPLVIQIIAIALACSTLAAVWHDVRTQAWADRWRYRRDVPFLPWIRRPKQQPAE